MKFGVVRFPGSNCDQDCLWALASIPGAQAEVLWHKDTSLGNCDAVILPGGFSYGDYLRCGAIARFSPVMRAVERFAAAGGLVLGICNGFQILCEAGLLPGALVRNRGLRFICAMATLRVETARAALTRRVQAGSVLRIPIAHGEGCYYADAATLDELEAEERVIFRYTAPDGSPDPAANPNGSLHAIAGICNAGRNVFGLMPHPERACDPLLGSSDGRLLFESLLAGP